MSNAIPAIDAEHEEVGRSFTDQGDVAHHFDYLFIGGHRVKSTGGGVIEVISPHSETVVGSVPSASRGDIDAAVAAASAALSADRWGGLSVADRLEIVRRFAVAYADLADEFAKAMTVEMGCPTSVVRKIHVDPAVAALRYYLALGERTKFEEYRNGVRPTLVLRRPIGVVAAIIPWNGPVYLTILKLAPALISGCTVVLKASPEAPFSSYVLIRAAEIAGLPAGVLNVLTAERDVSEYLVGHPGVDKVSFTGSTMVGQHIAQLCGQNLKRFNLELGGKSAAIILDDADLADVVQSLRMGSFANSGQVCAARTRILVPRSRYEEVVSAIGEMASSLCVGDPSDPATEIGPLVSERQRDTVLAHIRSAVEEGARLVSGGGSPPDLPSGFYVQPTVFADVSNEMKIARDEIFGPVIVLIGYDTDDEAIAITNDSAFGLAGSVHTPDIIRGLGIARRIETGTFGINAIGNDIGSPFGGVKLSGIGREMGPEGLEDYFEYKTIILRPEDRAIIEGISV